jgi:hypothetical protein
MANEEGEEEEDAKLPQPPVIKPPAALLSKSSPTKTVIQQITGIKRILPPATVQPLKKVKTDN